MTAGRGSSDVMRGADIVVLLVSKAFLESRYIAEVEMRLALELHEKRISVPVPVLVEEVPQYEDLPAELGDFRHVVRNIQKTTVRKGGLHLQNNFFFGDLIDVGQTFIHNQKIKILQQIADKIGAILLPQGKL